MKKVLALVLLVMLAVSPLAACGEGVKVGFVATNFSAESQARTANSFEALCKEKGWDCTVTLCHSRTKNLEQVCASADILIAALGTPGFVKANMVPVGR